ncbi:hypothetical protein [Streptomyces candidus]|uniref:Uncharacterized protein n=1 Tax=Streptomyces candidus TaxID=67283 RepID=A0A7X0LR13_9ACTN|nr:hypothetical protein [Streptomyces candidus]MBB6437009.1 hypothetical protein [Streptomyces candidus]GHH32609.1 hypothetical protein GCM10018773_01920 [Streptomyces candidus]
MITRLTAGDAARADAANWLAHAHADPPTAHHDWQARTLTVLPLGVRFDAVRIPADVLYAAILNVRPAGVSRLLDQLLGGPVVQDADRWFYPLVPVGRADRWQSRAARYLGRGAWLGVPQVDQVAPPGAYWAVPMQEPGRLCDLARVAELVAVGAARLTGRP